MRSAFKIIFLFSLLSSLHAQTDSAGMPGDHLDLRAVLAIFKDSKNVEDFEQKLNKADTKVNNLDLNNDGKVDYLRVHDYGKENFHSLVIQDLVSPSESQDVAVIEIEKKGDQEAHIQIVGDETLYGKNYIIEPQEKSRTEKNYVDDVYAPSTPPVIFVNVWGWPCVNYMYGPSYTMWASPWYWGYYPVWWSPWTPYNWYFYHNYMLVYYDYGWRRTYVNNMPGPHAIYAPHRSTSGYVEKNAVRKVPRPSYGPGNHRKKPTGVYPGNESPRQKNNIPGKNIPQQPVPRPKQNINSPRQISPPKQNTTIIKQEPSLRYGPTHTGGIRGGGGVMKPRPK
jgi:hypothetical protein